MAMQSVTDVRSNNHEQIAALAEFLKGATHKKTVFEAVCHGKKRVKSVKEIAASTALTEKQVLNAGKALAKHHFIHQTKAGSRVAYEKDDFLCMERTKVFRLAESSAKLQAYPTKRNPSGTKKKLNLHVEARHVRVDEVMVDDIDSFALVRTVDQEQPNVEMPEIRFKKGVLRILKESADPKDWGGERNDLFTRNLVIGGKRMSVAFALKGPGTRGQLTAAKMGKNGDQIQRLFASPAQVFVAQYWNGVADSLVEELKHRAMMKSYLEGRKVYFGVIDGQDSARLIRAYPTAFLG